MIFRYKFLLIIFLLFHNAALANFDYEPGFDDPALEKRAQQLFRQVKCSVCQGQTIDSSGSELATSLRIKIRQMLESGSADPEILSFIAERYGQDHVFISQIGDENLILWISPIIILLLGIVVIMVYRSQRKHNDKKRLICQ